MSTLLDLFETHKKFSEEDFNNLWNNALFVFDSNVLLDLYRLPQTAQQDLFALLEDQIISARTWIPFQVAVEFTYNRSTVIAEQKSKFHDVKSTIEGAIKKISDTYSTILDDIKKLDLNRRHSVIDVAPYVNDELFAVPVKTLNDFISELTKLDAVQPEVNDNDTTYERISKIFENKIGDVPAQSTLDAIYKEGENRYKEKIGPGYEDSDKKGSYYYHDLTIVRKYGDLLVWKQIIQKAIDEKLKYVILVTGDVKKDWWEEKRGKKIGPKYEIINEIHTKSTDLEMFYMYNTSTFMRYAKEKLKVNIAEESINEAKNLIESSKENEREFKYSDSIGGIQVLDIIERFTRVMPALRLEIHRFDSFIPLLMVPENDLKILFAELFSNVIHHSIDKSASVLVHSYNNSVIIECVNQFNSDPYNNNSRHKGLKSINKIMEKYGSAKWEAVGDTFKVRITFDPAFSY